MTDQPSDPASEPQDTPPVSEQPDEASTSAFPPPPEPDQASSDDSTSEYGSGPTGVPPAPQQTGMVRDPYSSLGGVASGLAHYYHVDVSLVRIAFVIFTVASGFLPGALLYGLAWLIMPRALYWPPIGRVGASSGLSNRDLVLTVLVVAGVAGLLASGAFGSALVPLLLIGGGVWLLNSSDSSPEMAAPATANPATAGSGPAPTPTATPFAQPPQMTPQMGKPVERTRRRRRYIVGAVIGALLFIVIPVLVVAAAFMAIVFGATDFDFKEGVDRTIRPTAVSDIPATIRHDAGSIVLDLADLDPDDFDGVDGLPIEAEIDLDFGEVTVHVPDDVVVNVDAEVGFGDLQVFDQNVSGIGSDLTGTSGGSADEAHIDLTIDLGAGQVTVTN